MLELGTRVKFIPDLVDPLSFPWFRDRLGTVVGIDDQVDSPYPYTVRFDFDKKDWPVKATELSTL